MSVKFVSKHSNYMVVLRPGVEGNRALGTHAVPGIYVKFQAGTVDVKEESIIKMLREHSAFGTDFLEIKPEEVEAGIADPYADQRVDIEPEHIISKVEHGMVGKNTAAKKPIKLTPTMKKAVEKEALKMIPKLLKSNPEILKSIIVEMAAEMKAAESQSEEAEPESTQEETE